MSVRIFANGTARWVISSCLEEEVERLLSNLQNLIILVTFCNDRILRISKL